MTPISTERGMSDWRRLRAPWSGLGESATLARRALQLIGCTVILTAVAASVSSAAEVITTVAGTGIGRFNGDGRPAASAEIYDPSGVASAPGGGFFIADRGNDRVRLVDSAGVIHTFAGTGIGGSGGGDGGPAAAASLNLPSAVAVTPDGGLLVAATADSRVRKVGPDGKISTVAGNGAQGFAGDGGPAVAAKLLGPDGLAVTSDGGFLIADSGNLRVRKVAPDGTITTVAGSGTMGSGGDGGPAAAAQLAAPQGVSVTSDGGFLIVDGVSQRVRKVSATGIISTVAGDGVQGTSGDGGPATAARLNYPSGVTATADRGFLIADLANHAIRKVGPDGIIRRVAGTGIAGFGGDGGLAIAAPLFEPSAVAVAPDGSVLIADRHNQRVRMVSRGFPRRRTPCRSGGRSARRRCLARQRRDRALAACAHRPRSRLAACRREARQAYRRTVARIRCESVRGARGRARCRAQARKAGRSRRYRAGSFSQDGQSR